MKRKSFAFLLPIVLILTGCDSDGLKSGSNDDHDDGGRDEKVWTYPCGYCYGSSSYDPDIDGERGTGLCMHCGGDGWKYNRYGDPTTCIDCDGTGVCGSCDGRGYFFL